MEKIIEINTDYMEKPRAEGDLFLNRALLADTYQNTAEVSIVVVAYNRLEKTRRCVESILKYTESVDYELILIDSGSQDGTLEYYDSVQFHKKKVIHITKNLGAAFAYSSLNLHELGRFICIVQNDLIVTSHWLDNLLACIKSDMRIGMVNPVTSNVSNRQFIDFTFKSYDEMQQIAAQYNKPDRKKWEERQKIVTLGTLYRKEVFLAAGWPMGDMGFFHDFFDDDISFTIRRLGYRIVLAGDTWICHDHDFRSGEGKNPIEHYKSLKKGSANFSEKYYGIDAWEDVCNSYKPFLGYIPVIEDSVPTRVLGIDVKCGTPILDMKNYLRKAGIFQVELSAFTQSPKYWMDLKCICKGGEVKCDREEFLGEAFPAEHFDYVIADFPFNCRQDSQRILEALFTLCRKGGIVVTKFHNSFSYQENSHLLMQKNTYGWEFFYQIFYHIPCETAKRSMEKLGTVKHMVDIPSELDEEHMQLLNSIIPSDFSQEERGEFLKRMSCREYMMVVQRL